MKFSSEDTFSVLIKAIPLVQYFLALTNFTHYTAIFAPELYHFKLSSYFPIVKSIPHGPLSKYKKTLQYVRDFEFKTEITKQPQGKGFSTIPTGCVAAKSNKSRYLLICSG